MTKSETVIDLIREHARMRPTHTAVVVDGKDGADAERIDYAGLLATVDRLAADLETAGLRRGHRCGLVAPQGLAFIEMALAILAAGGCLVPIPDDHAGAVLDAFAARAHLHQLILHCGTAAGRENYSSSENEPQASIWVQRALEAPAPLGDDADSDFVALEPAYMRFTSGTTSERKGVVIGHRAVIERLAAANRGLAITERDRIVWLLPMAHHFVVSILLYLRYGATILLPSTTLAQPILDFATREGATLFYASPYHLNLLAKDGSGISLGPVRLVISTADGLRANMAELFFERFAVAVVQALGIIEVGLPVLNTESARSKPTALGRALPDYRIDIRDEDGTLIENGGSETLSGEICIRGPGLFDAYLEPWTPSARLTDVYGFRTGDQGWIDDDGDLHLVGRRTNRINMAGMKFFSEEVEAVLDRHPAIVRSRVLAREHAQLGDIPIAEIVVQEGAVEPTRRELTAFCRQQLPTYKIPREFKRVDDLAMTATGKISRTDHRSR